MYRKSLKVLIQLAILISMLHSRLHRFGVNLGHKFFDLAIYHGRPGFVEWEVEREFADGYITVRVVENGVHQILNVNFRVSNRWPVRDGRDPGMAFLFSIRSMALGAGYPVIHSFWYTQSAVVKPRALIHVTHLQKRAEGFVERFARRMAGRLDTPDNSYDQVLREDLDRGVVRRV